MFSINICDESPIKVLFELQLVVAVSVLFSNYRIDVYETPTFVPIQHVYTHLHVCIYI